MSKYYEYVSEASPPVSLADMKTYLRIPATVTADDTLITALIGVVTQYGEMYTGRDFRAITRKLYLDDFAERIQIDKDPVDTITSITYTVAGSPVVVSSSIYYLKKNTTNSEILLVDGEEWPTDGDVVEHGIYIEFVTKGYTKAAATMVNAIKMHVSYMYLNRGDCDESGGVSDPNDSAKKSGANMLYNQFRISRV